MDQITARAISTLIALSTAAGAGCARPAPDATRADLDRAWSDQVLYHVMVRSFYDSDGDGHGDLDGVRQRLDYLQELGVTGLLLSPLAPSPFYHNYFADSFEGIDREYGSLGDYLALVRDVHARGMRLLLDMEVQYVTSAHPWFRDSYRNPASPYADFILYNDPANASDPEPLWPGYFSVPMYNGTTAEIATLNLKSDGLQQYIIDLFRFWADPDGDGAFDDGVDGFRIDHMMDDLDGKGRLTNLLHDFWRPIFRDVRRLNPNLLFVGEQAEWGYGEAALTQADADAVYAYPITFGIRSLDADMLRQAIDSTLTALPDDKERLVFAENHDLDRVASTVDADSAALRAVAALNLMLGGVPVLYYGQEIGMRGTTGEWGSDGNDIPLREAMDWFTDTAGSGVALWYEDSGPWWEASSLEPSDGISVEEQRADSSSLWHHYRQLIALRQETPALQDGAITLLETEQEGLLALKHDDGEEAVLFVMNLGDEPVSLAAQLDLEAYPRTLWNGPCAPGAARNAILGPLKFTLCAAAPDSSLATASASVSSP